MYDSTANELEANEPPNQPPDKFKVPLSRPKSAFQKVVPKNQPGGSSGSSEKPRVSNKNNFSAYNYILKKALRSPADITDNEKMILSTHPVIVELIKQTQAKDFSDTSYYIPIQMIMNYEYFHNAQIPILYDSREKWSLEGQVVQYTPPHEEEVSSDTTKSNSDYNLMLDEDDQRTIGKYTIRERKEKIRKYKQKLLKYKQGLCKPSNKYKQRSIIAKQKPRVRGKFAKTSPSTDMAVTH